MQTEIFHQKCIVILICCFLFTFLVEQSAHGEASVLSNPSFIDPESGPEKGADNPPPRAETINTSNTSMSRKQMPKNSTRVDWSERSIGQLQESMQKGELTSAQLVAFYLHRITLFNKPQASTTQPHETNYAINAVQHINPSAMEDAEQLDSERESQGPRGPLHGIPIMVKDNYETKGMPTTAGSKLFTNHQPERDAYLVSKLKQAGAVILGKTTMHEFAYGITTVGSNFGQTRNPYNLLRNPGGSSGGSGAAVAANFAAAAMGSDTCGSIRIPAAQNNLVGLRGTQGLSSRSGIVPLSVTQDIGGPLAKSVADLALVLDATVGYDPDDEQTALGKTHKVGGYHAELKLRSRARIGILQDWLVQDPQDQVVADVVVGALQQLQEQAQWQVSRHASDRVNLSLDRAYAGHLVLIRDFSSNIDEYLSDNPGIGHKNLQALIDSGLVHKDVVPSLHASANLAGIAPMDYQREIEQRQVVRQALLDLMHEHQLDALAYPTIRRVAAEVGAEQFGTNCRLSANSGLPAISVPAGFTADGLPVGLELLAEPFSESKLLQLAYTLEHHHPQRRIPPHAPSE